MCRKQSGAEMASCVDVLHIENQAGGDGAVEERRACFPLCLEATGHKVELQQKTDRLSAFDDAHWQLQVAGFPGFKFFLFVSRR